jgi:hypothetical protein
MNNQRSLAFKAFWVALAALTPFALLIAYAHLTRSWGMGWTPVIIAGALGLALFAMGPWRIRTRVVGGFLYTFAAYFVLPIMGLLAECSTGNCL